MIVAIGCDHAGFSLKPEIIKAVESCGHRALDLGTDSPAPADYPDFAAAVAKAVASGKAEKGILICGSGVGVCIAANKFRGIRAAVCRDVCCASKSVEHNDANVLCLGARVIGPDQARAIAESFLKAKFSGEERHKRRLEKITRIENEEMK